ncbi:MAG TPA: transcriptional repressor [Candidatus Dormibacteraeota bacterium]|nr:transcriptional repressor [Candidatus Dormibacteraeota bacterium]
MTGDLHDTVAARLQQGDNRYTRHRRALVEVLRAAKQPMTIAEILAVATDLPQSSVYRNLSVFEETGIVERLVGAGDFARFELAEELLGHHHHLVCSSCGMMLDVELPAELEKDIERALASLARRKRFQLRAHRLDLMGLCRECAAAEKAS